MLSWRQEGTPGAANTAGSNPLSEFKRTIVVHAAPTRHNSTLSSLFSPLPVGNRKLKNRLVALPVYTGYAQPEGRVSDWMIEHYRRLAESGVALVVVANAAVSLDGVVSRYNLRVDEEKFVPGLTRLADAVRQKGSLACLQLNHAGRFARTDRPLLPSPVDSANLAFNVSSLKNFMNFFPLEFRFGLTRYFLNQVNSWRRPMDSSDIERVVNGFGMAASRACKAGFDMVELHGAGGYLISQFLSPFTNKRTSDWGGSSEGRAAFALRVIREIKRRLPEGYPVGFRLMLREYVPGGIDLAQALDFATLLEKEGIAYLSASVGSYNSLFSETAMQTMAKPAYLKKDMQVLKARLKTPMVISGRILSPSLADGIIREGAADLIGLGRPLRVDPDWVQKASLPRHKIRTCINCNWCLKRVVLDRGFNCRRWSKNLQERADLCIQLLDRSYRGLWIVATKGDMQLLQKALPHLLPDSQKFHPSFSPTILFLKSEGLPRIPTPDQDRFLRWNERLLRVAGFESGSLQTLHRTTPKSLDREALSVIAHGNYGVILVGRNPEQRWRERLLYRGRGKVLGLIGSHGNARKVLVPVDLSPTTLLVLMFLQQAYIGKKGVTLDFIHVLTGSAGIARRRWKQVNDIVDMEQPLTLVPMAANANTAAAILRTAQRDDYGTIIMGKRGLSGIKRWMLGSVSAGVLRSLTDQSLFLID